MFKYLESMPKHILASGKPSQTPLNHTYFTTTVRINLSASINGSLHNLQGPLVSLTCTFSSLSLQILMIEKGRHFLVEEQNTFSKTIFYS